MCTGAGKGRQRAVIGTYTGGARKCGHGGSIGWLQDATKPVGNGLGALAAAKTGQDLLPLIIADEGGHDGFVGALLTAKLVELGSEGFFGLAHGGFIDALDVLLGFAPSAWHLAIALA